MAVVEVTADSFESEVLKSDKPVIVDFWADWCNPCRMLSPVVEQLAGEHADIKFCKVNVDQQPALAEKFNIMSIPALLAFKNGNHTNTSVGVVPPQQILNLVQ